MPVRKLPLLIALLVLVTACADTQTKLPGVYRISIQQGNVVSQKMLNQLQPGMTTRQVQFIMGTPVIQDPFHPERWDYIYSYTPGGGTRQQRLITLHFEGEELAFVEGNIEPGEQRDPETFREPSRTVDVPKREFRQGFFERLLNALPFVDQEAREQQREQQEDQQPPIQDQQLPPTVEDEVEPDQGLPTPGV